MGPGDDQRGAARSLPHIKDSLPIVQPPHSLAPAKIATLDFETLAGFVATSELSNWTYGRNNAGGNISHSYQYGTDENTALKIWISKGWTGDVTLGGVQIGFQRVRLTGEQDKQLFDLIDERAGKLSVYLPREVWMQPARVGPSQAG